MVSVKLIPARRSSRHRSARRHTPPTCPCRRLRWFISRRRRARDGRAGICAARSASASQTFSSIRSLADQLGIRSSDLADRPKGHPGHDHLRCRRRLRVQQLVAVRRHRRISHQGSMFKRLGSYTNYCAGGGTCFDAIHGYLIRSRVHGQRLYRPRHLEVPDAVHRRRRRRRLQPASPASSDNGINSDGRGGFGNTPATAIPGTWPGRAGRPHLQRDAELQG